MKLLRTVLYLDAVVWAATGVLLALIPVSLLEDVFHQVPLGDYVWVRMAAILGVGTALLMVMVAHRIETLWWFDWAFVLTEGALALLCACRMARKPCSGGCSPVSPPCSPRRCSSGSRRREPNARRSDAIVRRGSGRS